MKPVVKVNVKEVLEMVKNTPKKEVKETKKIIKKANLGILD